MRPPRVAAPSPALFLLADQELRQEDYDEQQRRRDDWPAPSPLAPAPRPPATLSPEALVAIEESRIARWRAEHPGRLTRARQRTFSRLQQRLADARALLRPGASANLNTSRAQAARPNRS